MKAGDGSHFEADKQRIRLMMGTREQKFLLFPGAFVLKKVLGLKSAVTRFGLGDFKKWVKVVLHAKSRIQLFEGEVKLPFDPRRKTWGFKPDIIREQQRAGKDQNRLLLEKVRDHKATFPKPEIWAAGIANRLGHKVDQEQAIKLADALDAAYQHDSALCSIVSNGPYNFEEHEGDWIDNQQLFYLCYPRMHLLTDDGPLKAKLRKSSQRDRVLGLRDFLSQRGFSPKH